MEGNTTYSYRAIINSFLRVISASSDGVQLLRRNQQILYIYIYIYI